jgi:hypothetical protein
MGDSDGGGMDRSGAPPKICESEVKNERCKFHISMKLEKMAVSSERSSSGWLVSRDSIIGVRKSWKEVELSEKCSAEDDSKYCIPRTPSSSHPHMYVLFHKIQLRFSVASLHGPR